MCTRLASFRFVSLSKELRMGPKNDEPALEHRLMTVASALVEQLFVQVRCPIVREGWGEGSSLLNLSTIGLQCQELNV